MIVTRMRMLRRGVSWCLVIALVVGWQLAKAHADPAESAGWSFSWSAWAQGDAMLYAAESSDQLHPETGQPLNETRMYLRRARLRTEAARGNWRAVLEFDGNTIDKPEARLLAANVNGRWAWQDAALMARVGMLKIPFGAELGEEERERIFPELTTASRALFPGNYDMGIHAAATWHNVGIVVAATNGAPVADAQWQGRDPSSAYDLMARLSYRGAPLRDMGLEIGVSGLVGKGLSPGRLPSNDDLVWVDANEDGLVQNTELQVIAGDPGLPASEFSHNALGVDAAATWTLGGSLAGRAFAEVVVATNLDRGLLVADPTAAARDFREFGWHIGLAQRLPLKMFVGVRYHQYRPDRDALDIQGETVARADPRWGALDAVVGADMRGMRLQAAYIHAQNPLGRNDAGQPATKSADQLLVRLTWGLK